MNPIPVGISTGVSFISAVSLVGVPAEMYINGYSFAISFVFEAIGYFLGLILVTHVVHPLRMSTLNEYLEKRYQSKVIVFCANVMVLICVFHYMGTCFLGSVIAFSSATGNQVSVPLALVIGGSVGIFYTSIGGLKAVVWTDVLQSVVMVGGVITVIVKSISDTPGGMATIIDVNKQYQHIHSPNLSTDLTVRHTIWGLSIGLMFNWGVWSAQPANVQRLCATKSIRDSYIVAGLATTIFLLFSFLPAWAGINIFAYYAHSGCDVHAAGWIEKNEIILYYVRDRLNLPGFQGVFVAALYAGSLSSMSSGLNAASAIIWSGMIKPNLKRSVSEIKATFISKIVVVVFGIGGMLWCYSLYLIGGLILQVSNATSASMYGSYFGLIILAFCFRYSNYKGAIAGLFVSFAFTFWLGLGSLLFGKSDVTNLPTTVATCASTSNSSELPTPGKPEQHTRSIYSISYCWLGLICLGMSLCVSLLVTACTGPRTVDVVDPNLLLPLCRPGICSKLKCRRKRYDSYQPTPVENIELNLPL